HVYLAGCTYAFTHDWISLYQIVCGKAGRDPAALAWSRRNMYPPVAPDLPLPPGLPASPDAPTSSGSRTSS
ncbi:MAG TPA: hypothetical protein VF861_15935, partial [Telluria sp.]